MHLQNHSPDLQPHKTRLNRGSETMPEIPKEQRVQHSMTSSEGRPLARPHQVQSSRTFLEESPRPMPLGAQVHSIFHQMISVRRTETVGTVETYQTLPALARGRGQVCLWAGTMK